jgi:hypothetical protein
VRDPHSTSSDSVISPDTLNFHPESPPVSDKAKLSGSQSPTPVGTRKLFLGQQKKACKIGRPFLYTVDQA